MGTHEGWAQVSRVNEGLRTAWPTVPGGTHPREKGSCVSRLSSLLRKCKLGGKGEPSFKPMGKTRILCRTVTPTFAFPYWFIEDHRIPCKGTPRGKIHHPFCAKTTKQNFTNQDAFTYLACDFSGWCSKQYETHADTSLVTEHNHPDLLHQTRQCHNFHLLNEQNRHCRYDAWIMQTIWTTGDSQQPKVTCSLLPRSLVLHLPIGWEVILFPIYRWNSKGPFQWKWLQESVFSPISGERVPLQIYYCIIGRPHVWAAILELVSLHQRMGASEFSF